MALYASPDDEFLKLLEFSQEIYNVRNKWFTCSNAEELVKFTKFYSMMHIKTDPSKVPRVTRVLTKYLKNKKLQSKLWLLINMAPHNPLMHTISTEYSRINRSNILVVPDDFNAPFRWIFYKEILDE